MTKITTTKILVTLITCIATTIVVSYGLAYIFGSLGSPGLGTFFGFLCAFIVPGRVFNWILKEELEAAQSESSEE